MDGLQVIPRHLARPSPCLCICSSRGLKHRGKVFSDYYDAATRSSAFELFLGIRERHPFDVFPLCFFSCSFRIHYRAVPLDLFIYLFMLFDTNVKTFIASKRCITMGRLYVA
uniref:Uncharacterized protein n=1 Tax=Physcomitrium patens TaxID=3218 RepID=A0A2K1KZZ8_PHYPA|nr:hypothetical protein PHYPA_002146 [Physcomitrium patens]